MPTKVQKFTFFPEMFGENTYVVSDTSKECVVVDPGCFHAHERKALLDYLEGENLVVKMLICTHLHIDHILGNRFLVDRFKVPLVAHRLDLYNLELAGKYSHLWGLPDPDSPVPDTLVEEGDEIRFGETNLHVLFVPGHSAGHIAFHDREGGNLFSGDVVFQNSIGRTDLPGGNHETLIQTIHDKVLVLPDTTKIFAGHMGVTNVGKERRDNPFLR